MKIDESIAYLANTLNIDTKNSLLLFDTFWEFIGDQLSAEGEVEITGLGKFYLEKNPESEKDIILKFEASEGFKNACGIKGGE